MSRLLRLMTRKAADSPSLWGGHVRDSSPLPVSSTLMTSAPRSASSMPQKGPASTRERSSTRIPSSESAGVVVMGERYHLLRYYGRHVPTQPRAAGAHPRARRRHGHHAPGARTCRPTTSAARTSRAATRTSSSRARTSSAASTRPTSRPAPTCVDDQHLRLHALRARRVRPGRARATRSRAPPRGSPREAGRASPAPALRIGAMGPTTQTITVTAQRHLRRAARRLPRCRRPGLIDGGVDALLLETCQDTRNVKAAALGIAAGPARGRRRAAAHGQRHRSSRWARCSPGQGVEALLTSRSSTSTCSPSASTAPPAPSS